MMDELFPEPAWTPPPPDEHRKPDGRIVLLDLNATLSANADLRHVVKPFTRFIDEVEVYRQWLVDLLRPEEVVLITVRNDRYKAATLRRIRQTTNWQPQVALFNDTGLPGSDAGEVKRRLVKALVLPHYGPDIDRYIALESNSSTRQMYSELGIYAVPINKERPWHKLPTSRTRGQ